MGRKHRHKKSSSKSVATVIAEDEAHPAHNKNIEIKHSDVMGRYLLARKKLMAGEVIMDKVEPLVVGPCQNSSHRNPICLGCHQIVSGDYRCTGCVWPMCGARCPGLGVRLGHTPEECALLAKVGRQEVDDLLKRVVRADGGTEEDAGEAYNPIVPLRCLLLKKHHPDRWKQINELESHNEIRKTSYPELWASNQRTVVDVVIKKWRIDEFTEEELHTVCGYLEVNSFSIGGRGGCIELRGLYGGHVSLMCHDCTPNTTHTDDESLLMTVRASLAIDKGQPITITYASTLQGTVQRRRHLRESKFFECRCRRCSDPRELGTMLSALRCANCRVGDLLPLKPLEDSSPWSCGSPNCGATVTSDQVQAIVGRIEADFDRIKEGTIEDLEDFLNRHEGVLHSNHYLMVGAMYPLSQMYGKLEGHMIHQMSEEGLARKVDICRSLLKIFGAIEPGMSRIRGVTLYELHAPLMVLTRRRFEARLLPGKEAKCWLREVAKCLEEASRILALEPEGTQESLMARAAGEALEATQQWQRVVSSL